ncbi:MAG TPA: hypothetical protein VGB24_14535 [Longimicrobium sp.]|jgi:hypothetical protein|uniref:hypothetical protein n=1 Tax=Longimicrobium sp. TaxID=2029185 RepID=UPI002EDBA0AC
MKLRRILALVALALPLLAACNDDSTGSGEASIPGTYTLRTVQGKKLPVTVPSGTGADVTITSGATTLQPNETYTLQLTFRTTEGTVVKTETYTEQGTYILNLDYDRITFVRSPSDSYPASIGDGKMVVDEEGLAFVYRK